MKKIIGKIGDIVYTLVILICGGFIFIPIADKVFTCLGGTMDDFWSSYFKGKGE